MLSCIFLLKSQAQWSVRESYVSTSRPRCRLQEPHVQLPSSQHEKTRPKVLTYKTLAQKKTFHFNTSTEIYQTITHNSNHVPRLLPHLHPHALRPPRRPLRRLLPPSILFLLIQQRHHRAQHNQHDQRPVHAEPPRRVLTLRIHQPTAPPTANQPRRRRRCRARHACCVWDHAGARERGGKRCGGGAGVAGSRTRSAGGWGSEEDDGDGDSDWGEERGEENWFVVDAVMEKKSHTCGTKIVRSRTHDALL